MLMKPCSVTTESNQTNTNPNIRNLKLNFQVLYLKQNEWYVLRSGGGKNSSEKLELGKIEAAR